MNDVGRANAFDKCAIPKTNGPDNRQSIIHLYPVAVRENDGYKAYIFQLLIPNPDEPTIDHWPVHGSSCDCAT